jgi:hypothetical protein
MKLRLVIDETSATVEPWWRLEELLEDGYGCLITSGYETEVRRVYERLKAAGAKQTLVEEWDSSNPQEPQPLVDNPAPPA